MGDSRTISVTWVLAGAAALGGVLGIASVAATPESRSAVAARTTETAIATGLKRAREPQPGDYWPRCAYARAAGTAPIYRGESGYRPELDGDDDGIACEPVPAGQTLSSAWSSGGGRGFRRRR